MVSEQPGPDRRRRPSVSVRTRIVAAITLVAALGLAAVGTSVYVVEHQRILENIDERLLANLASARFLIAEGDPEAGAVEAEPGAEEPAVSAWESSSAALAMVVRRMSPDDNTGAMGMADGVITTVPGIVLDVDLEHEDAFARHVHAQMGPGQPLIGTYVEEEAAWRYLAVPIRIEGSPEPAEVVFVLVYDVRAELDEINTAGRVFIIASLIALAVIAATGTVVATRLLRPLRQMREAAERITAESTDERLPIVGNDDVAELSETMNDMLDRLDDALDSQRRLLSDVGHELKTPITIVRGHLEVMDPDDPDDTLQTQRLAVDELERMDRLVQDLAAAATLHGPVPLRRAPVDTADLLDQIVRKAHGLTGAEVTRGETAHVVASLDAARITQALLQLVHNAVTHGGSSVEVGSEMDEQEVRFWVRDFGPGIPDAEKHLIFERFHRGEGAEAQPGSGLGLNIGQLIARAHGGSLSVEDAPGGGARFVLSVPLRRTDAVAATMSADGEG